MCIYIGIVLICSLHILKCAQGHHFACSIGGQSRSTRRWVWTELLLRCPSGGSWCGPLLLSAGRCQASGCRAQLGQSCSIHCQTFGFSQKPPTLSCLCHQVGAGCPPSLMLCTEASLLMCVQYWPAGGFGLVCTIFDKSELVANIKKIGRFPIKIWILGFS